MHENVCFLHVSFLHRTRLLSRVCFLHVSLYTQGFFYKWVFLQSVFFLRLLYLLVGFLHLSFLHNVHFFSCPGCFLHVSFFTWDTPALPDIFYMYVFYNWAFAWVTPLPRVFLHDVFTNEFTERIFPTTSLFTGRSFTKKNFFKHNLRFFSPTLGVLQNTFFPGWVSLHVWYYRWVPTRDTFSRFAFTHMV